MTRKDRSRRHAMAVAHQRREDRRTGERREGKPVTSGPVVQDRPRRKIRRLLTRASRRANR